MKQKIKHNDMLTTKQAMFIKAKAKGLNNTDSAIMAGYSPNSASSQASRLLKNVKIKRALVNAGLTNRVLAETIKTNIEQGVGVKADANTATKNVELALRLKGYLGSDKSPTSLSQTNVYIEEVKNMSDKDLNAKLDSITKEVKSLKTTSPSQR